MKFALATALCISSVSALTKEEAMKYATDNQLPPLAAFQHEYLSPELLKTFIDVNVKTLQSGSAFKYINADQMEVINAVTSALNNCELCLSFHLQRSRRYRRET